MKANELRIGNLFHPLNTRGEVHLPETSYVAKIAMIGLFDVQVCDFREPFTKGDLFELSIAKLVPIPLTEEWLVKFGFEYDPEDETWFKGGYYFTKNDEGNLSILEFPEAVAMYVHQLQNLYFALTGNELEIKL